MKFIAIHKTKKHLTKPSGFMKYMPDNYPIECEQNFETYEAARKKYPDALVMTEQAYFVYSHAFVPIYSAAVKRASLPWYKRIFS